MGPGNEAISQHHALYDYILLKTKHSEPKTVSTFGCFGLVGDDLQVTPLIQEVEAHNRMLVLHYETCIGRESYF